MRAVPIVQPRPRQPEDTAARAPGAHPIVLVVATTSILCPGVTIFFEGVLQDPLGQHGFGEHLLELGVFPFEFLQSLGLLQAHVSKWLPPAVVRHVLDVLPVVHLSQDADFPLHVAAFTFHDLVRFYGL